MKINCTLCSIAKNLDREKYRVLYEDQDFVAMLVNRPVTKGHFILLPKKHFSEISDMGNKTNSLVNTTLDLAEKLTSKLKAKAYTVKLNNKLYLLESGSLHIGHIHIHVIPRYVKNEDIDQETPIKDRAELSKVASAVK
jgi:histidine triad (HIT) family protein